MDNHYQTYYSNLSCYEEFDIKLVLAGEKDKILNVLKSISQKVDDYFWISTESGFVWFDNKGNHIDVPEKINGDFNCSDTNITTFVGCPKKVGGSFDCSFTNITSLVGSPKEVSGSFWCNNTDITSLEGCPQKVDGSFYCYDTNITSLKGCSQEVDGSFICYNTNITSLEGAPQEVGGYFDFYGTKVPQKEIEAYKEFLKNPTPEHIDETGHYKP